MGRSKNHNKNPRHVHHEPSQPSYGGVQKSRLEVKMRRKDGDKYVDDIRAEVIKERRAAEEAAAEGPSPGQRLRRGELLAEKENYLKRFTAANARIAAAKKAVDTAAAQYEEAKEEKRVMEAAYRDILTELGRIPADLSSSRGGTLRSGVDIVTKEEGENVAKQEVEHVVKQEGEYVVNQEKENVVKQEGENVMKQEEGGVVEEE
ncbi:hypothetical protein V499_08323 [Pseudogymnoascus sp. VKM F-103]|uniref:Uncharacterized protein n=1 Tax=Pseudogymnoascus verrucosus TaxID=342668 RepID=A0A2P2SWD2_9PEZI|nr:uncharacterized protein VE01_00727 [Pseudogymnoascus verrucosus]KFY71489.1 hypothetical protein V499_08323 [Pseudogymnoascus sp. VKM F-103]OBU01104.1 hypothetical protein VE01_00727 [Pseudogymnoascus verrucosus]